MDAIPERPARRLPSTHNTQRTAPRKGFRPDRPVRPAPTLCQTALAKDESGALRCIAGSPKAFKTGRNHPA